MKQFLGVLFFISAALAQDLLEDVDDESKQCLEELNLKSEQVRSLNSIEEMQTMTKEEKCLLRCVMKKTGIIDDKGNFVEEELDEGFEDLDVDLSQCTVQTTITDLCEQNYALTKCIVEILTEAAAPKN